MNKYKCQMMIFSLNIPDSVRNSKDFLGACAIIAKLHESGYHAWVVGGAPRDLLNGAIPHDYDIATSARLEDMIRIFPDAHALGASFGIVTVIENGIPYELASLREERDYLDGRHPETVLYTDDPQKDVLRRDFTVNALLLDPIQENLIDYVGGVDDLHHGILRTVGDAKQRFAEDYLRILRAVRFAVRLDAAPDSTMLDAIPLFAQKLHFISAERIRDELDKILLGKHPAKAFRMMSDLGILRVIFPELEHLKGVEQPKKYHPEGDVFTHTMLMLDHMVCPSRELAWSILLHDVAKPATQFFGDDGIPRFYGHEAKGAELAEPILKRFRMPQTLSKNVVAAIRGHMRFASVLQMRPATLRRMVSDPNFPLELELHRIDCMSSHRKMDVYTRLLDYWNELRASEVGCRLPTPYLTGRDLLAMGARPGPAMGKFLTHLMDLQLEGKLTSREEALSYARESYESGRLDSH